MKGVVGQVRKHKVSVLTTKNPLSETIRKSVLSETVEPVIEHL